MKRRQFMKAATAISATAAPIPTHADTKRPLKAKHRVRILRMGPERSLGYLLLSDGPKEPRSLIRPEVVDKTFGKGTYQVLTQPDHWEMIDAGWFGGDDLFEPTDPYSRELRIWGSCYRPECEAHDLLLDLFSDQVDGILKYSIPELGLTFAEHPCTPRLATVYLSNKDQLGDLASAVSARTEWMKICLNHFA